MSGEEQDSMESNLIIIENSKKYFVETFEELEKLIFGEEYSGLSFNEKFKIRYDKAYGICIKNDLELVETKVGLLGEDGEVVSKEYNFSKAFIIDNEKTFIFSLCKFENLLILEKKDSNILYIEGVGNIEKEDNYMVINKIADELLLLNLKL